MIDLGKIVYLDMQKTGSSFTTKFLRRCCTLKSVSADTHGIAQKNVDKDAFFFTTIRNPFDLYVSLFKFGCQGKGGTYIRLRSAGLDGCYKPDTASFNKWLELMLGGEEAGADDPKFKLLKPYGIGLMSFRHLKLSFQFPFRKFREITSYEDVEKLYENDKILNKVVRNEELAEGLSEIATDMFPQYFDAKRVSAFLAENERVNASPAPDEADLTIAPEHRKTILEREKFLFERFYPDAA